MKPKELKAWCPKSPRGKLYIGNITMFRKDAVFELEECVIRWKERGYTVVRVKIIEVKK